MMDIEYKGHAAQPSDYLCEDGQIEAAIDMVPADGGMAPFRQPYAPGLVLDPLTQFLFIHQTASYTHYIVYDTSDGNITLYYLVSITGQQTVSDSTVIVTLEGQTLNSITAIGNIIILSTAAQMAYIRWDTDEQAYTYLGDSVPDPQLTFGLNSLLLNKTYSGTGIELEDASAGVMSSQAGGWEDVTSTQAEVDSTDTSTRTVYFDDDLTIEANRWYRWVITVHSGSFHGVVIWGTNSETGDVERLGGGTNLTRALDFNNADQTVDHTNIYAVFATNYNMAYTLDCTITMQAGASMTYGRIVDYNETSYNAIMGCINDFVASKGTEDNRFIHPFFVRYAVRLYDGSHSYVSPPMLMTPNTAYAPFVFYNYAANSKPMLVAFVSELQYKMEASIDETWDDIIDGVDIYVSSPIYPYDQSLEYDEDEDRFSYLMYNCEDNNSANDIINNIEGFNYTVGTVELSGSDVSDEAEDAHGDTTGHLMKDLYDYIVAGSTLDLLPSDDTDATDGAYNIVLAAARDDDEMLEQYRSVAAFYRIKQLSMAELRNEDGASTEDDDGFITLEMPTGTLSTLEAQVALDEDTIALTACQGASLYAYNNRLHVFNASTKFAAPTLPCRQNSYMTPHEDDGVVSHPMYTYVVSDIWVFIKTEDGDRVAHVDGDGYYHTFDNAFWFFYPEARAYKALFLYDVYYTSKLKERIELYSNMYCEIPLTSHDYLTGAYVFVLPTSGTNVLNADGVTVSSTPPDDLPDSTADTLLRASTVYVSEASNPFAYTASSVVSVGAETIYALAAAARPLSVGQFGDFPLYAFTSEGVWAFTTSDTGVYEARQPITRDICINPAGIVQMDQSVLFATDRGIMEIVGSQCECLTNTIDNRRGRFDITALQSIDALLETVETGYLSDAMALDDMRTFMASAVIVYDYIHRRLFFSNPEITSSGGIARPYTYVLDLATGQWSFVSTLIASTTNSYPEAIAVLTDGHVVTFAEEETASPIHCALLTRPLKMGDADTHKTVRTVIQRGQFPTGVANTVDGVGPVRQVLYASNDMTNWFAVASSNKHYLRNYSGTGWKYYRVLLLCYLKPEDNIAGMSIEMIEKRNNQIR